MQGRVALYLRIRKMARPWISTCASANKPRLAVCDDQARRHRTVLCGTGARVLRGTVCAGASRAGNPVRKSVGLVPSDSSHCALLDLAPQTANLVQSERTSDADGRLPLDPTELRAAGDEPQPPASIGGRVPAVSGPYSRVDGNIRKEFIGPGLLSYPDYANAREAAVSARAARRAGRPRARSERGRTRQTQGRAKLGAGARPAGAWGAARSAAGEPV